MTPHTIEHDGLKIRFVNIIPTFFLPDCAMSIDELHFTVDNDNILLKCFVKKSLVSPIACVIELYAKENKLDLSGRTQYHFHKIKEVQVENSDLDLSKNFTCCLEVISSVFNESYLE